MSQNNPDLVSEAFSKQSEVFDKLDEENLLSAHLRKIFRKEVEKHTSPGSSILELNCGTGIDALPDLRRLAPGLPIVMMSGLTGLRDRIEPPQLLAGFQIVRRDEAAAGSGGASRCAAAGAHDDLAIDDERTTVVHALRTDLPHACGCNGIG